VLNYSRQDQFDLLKSVGIASPDWLALGRVSAVLIALLALGGGLWSIWSSRPRDAWSRQRAQVVRALRALGLDAAPHQGPRHWATLLQQRFGAEAAAPSLALLAELEQSRYSPAAAPQGWRDRLRWRLALRQALRRLRHTAAPASGASASPPPSSSH